MILSVPSKKIEIKRSNGQEKKPPQTTNDKILVVLIFFEIKFPSPQAIAAARTNAKPINEVSFFKFMPIITIPKNAINAPIICHMVIFV